LSHPAGIGRNGTQPVISPGESQNNRLNTFSILMGKRIARRTARQAEAFLKDIIKRYSGLSLAMKLAAPDL
jgi:hypothetical protein